jgi:hypothetical protein
LISSFLSRIFLLHLEMHATKILDADFVWWFAKNFGEFFFYTYLH